MRDNVIQLDPNIVWTNYKYIPEVIEDIEFQYNYKNADAGRLPPDLKQVHTTSIVLETLHFKLNDT